jgi:hypothetical protein
MLRTILLAAAMIILTISSVSAQSCYLFLIFREPESIQVHGDTVIVMGRETVVPKGNSPDAGKPFTEGTQTSG